MTETMGIGLVGLGTVGTSVARRLLDEWALLGERAGAIPVLRRIAVRDTSRPRDVDTSRVRVGDDAEALVDDDAVDIVVEVMGGVDRATALMERALRAGKPVVTANKAAIAAHGLELAALAAEHNASLRYEAAVGAGLPVVALLRDGLRGDRVQGMEMIINGTTNVILTAMATRGLTLDEALAEAQQRGFAEADPSADVDGRDVAAKLLILSRLAFDAPLSAEDVDVTGIRGVAAADVAATAVFGGSIKLVARAVVDDAAVALSVRPTVVLPGHPLHGVDDSENVLRICSDLAASVIMRGLGAGGDSTASAVVSDIVATVRDPHRAPPLPTAAVTATDGAQVETRGYLRVQLRDVADSARLALQALEDRGIPVVSSAELDGELALLTGAVPRQMLQRAEETLESLVSVDAVATLLDCVGPR